MITRRASFKAYVEFTAGEGLVTGGETPATLTGSLAAAASRSPSGFVEATVLDGAVGTVFSSAAPLWAAVSPSEGARVVSDLRASAEI